MSLYFSEKAGCGLAIAMRHLGCGPETSDPGSQGLDEARMTRPLLASRCLNISDILPFLFEISDQKIKKILSFFVTLIRFRVSLVLYQQGSC